MINHPKLLSSTIITPNSEIELCLQITHDICYFQGHFFEQPILPGVAQLDWAIAYAADYLAIKVATITDISQIKFTKIIRPGMIIKLNLRRSVEALYFQYFDADYFYSTGKIKLPREMQ